MIRQGEVYWICLEEPRGSEAGFRHPHVVIQSDAFNQSLIRTILVCPLTSNLSRARAPGNVLLEEREANLPKRSVVNVSQTHAVDKSTLDEKIGQLSAKRVAQIVQGVWTMIEPRSIE